MTVYEGSRYDGAPVIRTPGADGRSRPAVYSMLPLPIGAYQNYIAREGDRFDLIAHSLWGDAELWWRIADINPEVFHPHAIEPGTILRIPA